MATDNPTPTPLESERIHRRQVFRQITLPLVGVGLFLVLAIAAPITLFMLPDTAKVATLSNIMVILFLLLPNVLCLLGLYLLLAYAIAGVGIFNRASARRLRQLNRLSVNVSERTTTITENIDRRTLDARVRIAEIESVMERAFQPAEKPDANDETDRENETKS
jgi:hypothetical protein